MKRILSVFLTLLVLTSFGQRKPAFVNGQRYLAKLEDMWFTQDVGGIIQSSTNIWTGALSGTAFANFGGGYRYLASGTDGYIESQFTADAAQACVLGFTTSHKPIIYSNSPFYIAGAYLYGAGTHPSGLYYLDGNNSGTSAGVNLNIGDYFRVSRVGTVTKLQTSTDHTTWTDRFTYTTTSTALWYTNANQDLSTGSTNKLYYPRIYNGSKHKVVVCDGNSLTACYGTSSIDSCWPSRMQANNPTWRTVNKGVSGQTTGDMLSDITTDIFPSLDPNTRTNLFCWEGGNDLYFNGRVDSAVARLRRYCTISHNYGFKVVVVTIPYRDASVINGGTSPAGDADAVYNTKRLQINDSITITGVGADLVVDLANQPGFTQATANFTGSGTYPYFYTDHVHFIDAGQLAIYLYFYSLVSSFVYTEPKIIRMNTYYRNVA